MAMTTSNSIRVNPRLFRSTCCLHRGAGDPQGDRPDAVFFEIDFDFDIERSRFTNENFAIPNNRSSGIYCDGSASQGLETTIPFTLILHAEYSTRNRSRGAESWPKLPALPVSGNELRTELAKTACQYQATLATSG